MTSYLDLLVLGVYLAGVVAFGLWVGRHQKGAADYMLGDRNIPWWGLLFSIVATETSTVTFLSIPGFAWGRDFTFMQLPDRLHDRAPAGGGRSSCPTTSPASTSRPTRCCASASAAPVGQAASFLFVVTRSLADGLRLFLTAIVVQEISGFSLPVSIALVGVTTIVYTFVGGMKAVVWTDVIQFVVYVRRRRRGARAAGGPPARRLGRARRRRARPRASSAGSISRPPSTAPTRCGRA